MKYEREKVLSMARAIAVVTDQSNEAELVLLAQVHAIAATIVGAYPEGNRKFVADTVLQHLPRAIAHYERVNFEMRQRGIAADKDWIHRH